MEREERITKMEEILDHSAELVEKVERILKDLEEYKKEYYKLVNYYYSEDWRKDVEAYNQNLISHDLKCGVLTEDAIYDLIGERYNLAIYMLEQATDMIKNF